MLLGDKADYDCKQAGTFDEGADDDGGHPVVSGLFRLACTCLEGSLTYFSDTECGSQRGKSSAEGLTESPKGQSCLKNKC